MSAPKFKIQTVTQPAIQSTDNNDHHEQPTHRQWVTHNMNQSRPHQSLRAQPSFTQWAKEGMGATPNV